jgi:DNA replication protein DnaC
MPDAREAIQAAIARMQTIASDPDYQANVAKWDVVDAAMAKATREAGLRKCGVPEEHWGNLANPKDEPGLLAARRLVDGRPEFRFLVLSGNVGRGKSFALAWAVAQTGGRFIDAQDLVAASSFDREWWSSLEAVSVLAVDELGAEKGNAEYDANLYALLNGRFSRGRKTLIGTNFGFKAFRERYLGGGLSRLLDRFEKGGEWVTLRGESMRRHWAEGGES